MKNLYFIIILSLFVGCRTAQWHYEKAVDKGMVVKPETITAVVRDTIKGEDGKDSIIYRDIELPCPDIEFPQTRWEKRLENRRLKDSLKYMRKMYNDSLNFSFKTIKANNALLKDSLREARKINNSDNRRARSESRHNSYGFFDYFLLVIVFLAGFFTRHFISRLLFKTPTR